MLRRAVDRLLDLLYPPAPGDRAFTDAERLVAVAVLLGLVALGILASWH